LRDGPVSPSPTGALRAIVVSFVAVFLYEVKPATGPAFEAAYGSDGEWARFFERGDGYAGTELWRASDTDPHRYLVIDRWHSEPAYEDFLGSHADEYRRRSALAARLYVSERALGRYRRI
jgi:heme-degrading monooxygenase HmoA